VALADVGDRGGGGAAAGGNGRVHMVSGRCGARLASADRAAVRVQRRSLALLVCAFHRSSMHAAVLID